MDSDYPYRSSRPTSYVNKELANALIDVVQVTRNGSSRPVSASNSQLGLAAIADGTHRSPSPRMPGAYDMDSPSKDPFRDDNETGRSEARGHVEKDRAEFKGSSGSNLRSDKNKSSSRKDKSSKEGAERKPTRHADVIDTWDPSGVGSALWHHSGPYDAAAPSRNLNQPSHKAPMHAFNAREEAAAKAAAANSPTRTGPTAISHAPAPPVPPKDESAGRRPSARNMPRRTSGGLSGTYSTSYPTGGGYFPNQDRLPDDENQTSPSYQRRQKEEKQKALKAAWGIDEPEPFEDFGTSPRDESYIDLADHLGNNDARGGFLFGRGPKSPTVDTPSSPTAEDTTFNSRASISRPGGGVKRTKSLMQKIKSMRGDRSDRSSSPNKYSPGNEYPPMPAVSPGLASGSPAGHGSKPSIDDHLRPSPPARPARAAGRSGGSSLSISAPSTAPGSKSASATNSAHGHSASLPPDDAQEIIESGNGHSHSQSSGYDYNNHQSSSNSNAMRRPSKNLPLPPVGPVMPDFEDIVRDRRRPSLSSNSYLSAEVAPGAEGVKRKTSVVKRLAGRVSK